jgi:hypothetical protein
LVGRLIVVNVPQQFLDRCPQSSITGASCVQECGTLPWGQRQRFVEQLLDQL